jgi:hypothetical protein
MYSQQTKKLNLGKIVFGDDLFLGQNASSTTSNHQTEETVSPETICEAVG